MFADTWNEAAFYLVLVWIVMPALVARSLFKKAKDSGVLGHLAEEAKKQNVAGKVVEAAIGKLFKK